MRKANFFQKAFGIFTAIALLNATFTPTVFALSGGSIQPEYAEYESGATDMVQLLTGDFTYSIPLMNIPSPEGNFSFPISYHSGIQPDQEASWVGLGWSLNVGAINRNVSQFPDDFRGEDSNNEYKDPGQHGWIKNWLIGTTTYNSNTGRGGSLNLFGIIQFGWGTQAGVSALGVSYERGEKVNFDVGEFALSVVNIAMTVATSGASTVAQAVGAVAVQGAVGAVIAGVIGSLARADTHTPNVNHWTSTIIKINMGLTSETRYSYKLDYTETEDLYGSLYLGDVLPESSTAYYPPFVHQGASSYTTFSPSSAGTYSPERFQVQASGDVYYNIKGINISKTNEPTHIAYDHYSVMGRNASGQIAPYRLDMGSVAFPSRYDDDYQRYNAVKFLNSYAPYKVHFNYVGEMANEYRHHASGSDLTTHDHGVTAYTGATSFTGSNPYKWTHFELGDTKLLDNNTYKVEADRSSGEGLKNKHLASSKYIEWFSNNEIYTNNTTYAQNRGFIDINNGTARSTFRDALPDYGIGGFMVVADDGTTYHYALPVYVSYEKTYVGSSDGTTKYGTRELEEPYAVTWLLTAITGPDFLDRGGTAGAANGILDEDDWGYWVKFEYNKYSDDYSYRTPYHNNYVTIGPSGEDDSYSMNYGIREVYYLDRIQTRTHTALFVKSPRKDGKGHYYTTGTQTKPTSVLKLDEIILLANAQHDSLVNTLSFTHDDGGTVSSYTTLQNGELIDKVIDGADIDATARTFITERQLQRIVFNYDYSLCTESLNSFEFDGSGNPPWNSTPVYTGKGGKLTLKSLSIYGRNDVKFSPDYDLTYSTKNPTYHADKWDKWGMYSADGGSGYAAHDYFYSPETNRDEDYWHLKEISTPTGGKITIDYERDSYSEISGYNVDALSRKYGISSIDYGNHEITLNTNIDLADIITLPASIKVNDWLCFNVTPQDYSGTYGIESIDGNTLELDDTNFPASCPVALATPYVNLTTGKNIDGGDLRVKQVTVSDVLDGHVTKNVTQYQYNLAHDATKSAGVCSIEPIWSRSTGFEFYDYYDYPQTPIYYKNVTVLQGSTDSETYLNKKVYEFETPHANLYEMENNYVISPVTNPVLNPKFIPFIRPMTFFYKTVQRQHEIYSNLAVIGRINSVKEYNNQGHLTNSSVYHYVDRSNFDENASPAIPGLRTEGTFHTAKVVSLKTKSNEPYGWDFIFDRTTKVQYPNVLDKIVVTKDGYTYEIANQEYDFVTGIILKQQYCNSLGYQFLSEIVPAHHAYTEMGSKVDDITNKNMMSQASGDYLYVYDPATAGYKGIQASVQTWSDDWGSGMNDAWRKKGQYVWSSAVNRDGTFYASATTNFPAFSTFNYSSPTSDWQLLSEITQYNNYSFPIETRTNSHYSAVLKDNRGAEIIATASNAKYAEITFSDAELPKNSDNEFNGRVTTTGTVNRIDGKSTDIDPVTGGVQPLIPHTGDYVYELLEDASLDYTGVMGTMLTGTTFYPIPQNKVYRLSYWQHHLNNYSQATSAPNLKVGVYGGTGWYDPGDDPPYVTGYSSTTPLSTTNTTLDGANILNCSYTQFGYWFLVEADIVVTTDKAAELRIYLENPDTDPIYIDDLRLLPLNATMACKVIDYWSGTSRPKATLDNQHIPTKYVYYTADDYKVDKVKEVYRGVMGGTGVGGLKKIAEKDYNIVK